MSATLIILSAGQGQRLKPITNDRPKGMVPIGEGKTIIDWQINIAQQCGSEKIIIITGFCAQNVKADATLINNPAYATTNMVQSLWCASEKFGEEIIISYGDILSKNMEGVTSKPK